MVKDDLLQAIKEKCIECSRRYSDNRGMASNTGDRICPQCGINSVFSNDSKYCEKHGDKLKPRGHRCYDPAPCPLWKYCVLEPAYLRESGKR